MTFARTAATRLIMALGVCAATIAAGPRQAKLDLALDRYSTGEHSAAIAGVDPTMTLGALRVAAGRWIQAGDASARARR